MFTMAGLVQSPQLGLSTKVSIIKMVNKTPYHIIEGNYSQTKEDIIKYIIASKTLVSC